MNVSGVNAAMQLQMSPAIAALKASQEMPQQLVEQLVAVNVQNELQAQQMAMISQLIDISV